MGRFDGKVAIVTGAGRGIGRAEALLLASEGAAVVVNDLGGAADGSGGDVGPADEVVAEIEAAGGAAVADGGSVASWSDAEALVQRAVDVFGGLDIVINNAGILRDRMSFTMEEAEWDAVVNVHMKGHFCVARHAAAYWRSTFKQTGEPVNAVMINTTSESGLYGNAGQLNYAAAKAGIASMTIVLARELERLGVRVNAIAPVARTRLTEELAGDAMKPGEDGFDRFAPENVAAVAVWLASDLASSVNGQVVKVMGGVVQLVQGWRPLTEATSDKPWTIDSVDAAKATLLAKDDGSIPPFFFPSPA